MSAASQPWQPGRLGCWIAAVAAGSLPVLLFAYAGGPPGRRTGAPGDRTCLDANCHVGERFENSAAVTLDTGTSLTYPAGGPRQRWTVRISDERARAFGIELTVRRVADPARLAAGDLASIDPGVTTVLCEDNQPRSAGPCREAAPVQFFLHTEPRRTGEFVLEWTPPPVDAGDLDVYVAANASVSGQRNSRIHLRSFRLRSAAASPSAATLVDAAAGLSRFASGSWVAVFGTGLAESTRAWSAADIVDGVLPTSLDGVELRINGRNAPVALVSPTQINALAPDDETAPGAAAVEVLQRGRVVAQGSAQRVPVAPALFEVPGSSPRRAVSVVPLNAPGTLVLFGSGFGPTAPPAAQGRTLDAPARLANSVVFRIGQQTAPVLWAGLICPGLYQFNLTIPPLPTGDHPVEAVISGVATQPGLLLRVGAQ